MAAADYRAYPDCNPRSGYLGSRASKSQHNRPGEGSPARSLTLFFLLVNVPARARETPRGRQKAGPTRSADAIPRGGHGILSASGEISGWPVIVPTCRVIFRDF